MNNEINDFPLPFEGIPMKDCAIPWVAYCDLDPHREMILRRKYVLEYHHCPFHREDMKKDTDGGHYCPAGDCVTTYLYRGDGFVEENLTDEWNWMKFHLVCPTDNDQYVKSYAQQRVYGNWGHGLTANKVARRMLLG